MGWGGYVKIYIVNTYCSSEVFFTNNFQLIGVVVELFHLWSFRVPVQSKFTIMWMGVSFYLLRGFQTFNSTAVRYCSSCVGVSWLWKSNLQATVCEIFHRSSNNSMPPRPPLPTDKPKMCVSCQFLNTHALHQNLKWNLTLSSDMSGCSAFDDSAQEVLDIVFPRVVLPNPQEPSNWFQSEVDTRDR